MQKIKAHKQAFRRALRILYWVGLMILYLCAASRPGVWLRDAFLYRHCLLYTSDAATTTLV